MKVTNEQLMDKLEKMDQRIVALEEFMHRSKGSVSIIAWLAGLAVVVGGYFYNE